MPEWDGAICVSSDGPSGLDATVSTSSRTHLSQLTRLIPGRWSVVSSSSTILSFTLLLVSVATAAPALPTDPGTRLPIDLAHPKCQEWNWTQTSWVGEL